MFRPAFDSVVLLVAWSLWKERNTRIFTNKNKNPMQLGKSVVDELEQWMQASHSNLAVLMAQRSHNSLLSSHVFRAVLRLLESR